MKQTTAIVAALVLVAAISAVWFAREQAGGEQFAAPIADAIQPSLPGAEPSATAEPAIVPDHEFADAPAVPAAALPSTEPVRLFSSPDIGSLDYLNAMNNANVHLAKSRRRNDTRSIQLLKRNEEAIDELVRQLSSNPDGLRTAFEISPPNIHACTISTIRDRSPDFTPSALAPSSFSVESSCDESGDHVTVSVDRSELGTVAFAIRNVQGGVSILSVDESGYVAAFQRYPFVPTSE